MAKPDRNGKTTAFSSNTIFFVVAGLIVAATFTIYRQVHSFEFISIDDVSYASQNSNVQSGLSFDSIKWAFTTFDSANWHPLTWLSLMLDYELYGLNASGFHITNLIFHLANTVLLFWLFLRMTKTFWPSAFVAALFALHPLHVESVAWIAERKDVLSTFFWFLTMLAYLRYTENKTNSRYAVVIILFILGLMAKPMLVTLPFVLLLMDYWPLNRLSKNAVLEKLPLFAISACSSVVTFFAQKSGGSVSNIQSLPINFRIGNAIISYAQYLSKTFWPAKLAFFYPYPVNGLPANHVIFAALTIIAGSVLVIHYRHLKWLITGWLWYLGTLVPVIGLVQVGGQAMADRYTYIPLVGIFIICGWFACELLPRLRYRNIILASSAMIILSALAVRTYGQIGYWRNSLTLYNHSLSITEDNPLLRYSLASYLVRKGDTKEALEQFLRCYKMDSMNPDTNYSLGYLYDKQGNAEKALEYYLQAVQIKADYFDVYCNLGAIYGKLGRYQDAVEAHKEAIRIKPDDAGSYYNLGISYGKLDRRQDAIEAYRQVVKIKPDYAEAYYNLGVNYGKLDHRQDAIEYYKQAVRIKPDYAEAHYNLGVSYLLVGDRGAAIEEYEILKTLNAEQANRLFNLINK